MVVAEALVHKILVEPGKFTDTPFHTFARSLQGQPFSVCATGRSVVEAERNAASCLLARCYINATEGPQSAHAKVGGLERGVDDSELVIASSFRLDEILHDDFVRANRYLADKALPLVPNYTLEVYVRKQ